MFAVNTVCVVGRLVRDVELKHTPSGSAVAQMRLAVDGAGAKDAEGHYQAGFFDVEAWEKQAENCSQYLTKGSQVGIVGRLKFREWEGKDGTKRNAVDIIASNVQFLTPKGERDDEHQTSFAPTTSSGPPPADPSPDDDIPF